VSDNVEKRFKTGGDDDDDDDDETACHHSSAWKFEINTIFWENLWTFV
jgi:hypothetical protein